MPSFRLAGFALAGFLLFQVPSGQRVTGFSEAKSVSTSAKHALTDRYGDPLPPMAIARLGTNRFRPGCPVSSLAYSPNGKTLVSTDFLKVRQWDCSTGKVISSLPATNIGQHPSAA